MRNILVAVAGLVVLLGLWRLGLLWFGAGADTTGIKPNQPSISDKVFQGKYDMIQIDMSEQEVDKILAGYPSWTIKLPEHLQEESMDTFEPFKRKALYMKNYASKHGAEEGDFYIHVFLDENYEVVGKFLGEYIS